MPLKFGANLSFMFQNETSDLLTRYTFAKNAGFKGVEIAFPYDIDKNKLRDAKEKSGLKQILVNAFPGELFTFKWFRKC